MIVVQEVNDDKDAREVLVLTESMTDINDSAVRPTKAQETDLCRLDFVMTGLQQGSRATSTLFVPFFLSSHLLRRSVQDYFW